MPDLCQCCGGAGVVGTLLLLLPALDTVMLNIVYTIRIHGHWAQACLRSPPPCLIFLEIVLV